jgi:hypothetical protein
MERVEAIDGLLFESSTQDLTHKFDVEVGFQVKLLRRPSISL